MPALNQGTGQLSAFAKTLKKGKGKGKKKSVKHRRMKSQDQRGVSQIDEDEEDGEGGAEEGVENPSNRGEGPEYNEESKREGGGDKHRLNVD